MAKNNLKYYLQIRNNFECRCGNDKDIGKPFCINCVKMLPDNIRLHLHRCMGDGFEEAVDEANTYLEETAEDAREWWESQ